MATDFFTWHDPTATRLPFIPTIVHERPLNYEWAPGEKEIFATAITAARERTDYDSINQVIRDMIEAKFGVSTIALIPNHQRPEVLRMIEALQ